jgi:hypothetical protein
MSSMSVLERRMDWLRLKFQFLNHPVFPVSLYIPGILLIIL